MKYRYTSYTAPCPVCGNTDNELLYKISADEAAKQFLINQTPPDKNNEMDVLSIVKKNISKLWNANSAAIVNCKKCGFGFADPYVGGDKEFYNLISHAPNEPTAEDEPKPYWKWEFDKAYNKIADLAKTNSNLQLLEIGASTGNFVKRVSNIIPKKNILCLEYSSIGVDSIKKAGITAQSWHFHGLASKPEFLAKFDVICLFQVLEHLDDLEATFDTFNAIIKPGGHLFIGVPNGKKIKFNELNGALLDLPPNHIGRYNKRSFEILAGKYQWEVAEFAIETYTPLDVMKTVMYSQSLKKAQYPPAIRTLKYRLKEYMNIKRLRLQAQFKHKNLGECIYVHYKKALK
ncbi:class I SAM-dependent methyltransferase [Mucilaginibacter phyllosphaerae]|uniref:2-polyprenyl-3-methyl-5-hydroxy-6-metoxy-1, 4-benzoquinol methylase n=1 Tax=Mucilaginibacter phyllosphaerae TaxID=1812349 RepID=A0A4Y8AGE1_9SPHI|nr:class I SAM-dependent methyltransferase [Mucilaginibacter phyllosphaerae]MBB3968541.1 2-polyprenyl-3-methyl-5-hydroxy-6-metoxy-1,4-benzoquinol methylase [Mucilaginibacter phyllosphaerae]TEW67818.1 class I SAM-dependent methyltransferase [Mucilaginibacter phyllosphaerae]GGH15371.1 hypothetical protein GCM10007352_24100 [Mucilaginibacter phyllosphaerae]